MAEASASSFNEEWALSLVGREWETFWKPDLPSNPTSNDQPEATNTSELPPPSTSTNPNSAVDTHPQSDDDDDDEDDPVIHEEGWYDAQVIKYLGLQQFEVQFVGEDFGRTIALNVDVVRPSARSWIRRTRALLSGGGSSSEDVESWRHNLPPDTRTLDDRDALADIHYAVTAKDFPIVPSAVSLAALQDHQEVVLSASDLDSIRTLVIYIRTQIWLRQRLTSDGDSAKSDNATPTAMYLDSLTDCLNDMDAHCMWYYRCWSLQVKIFASNNHDDGGSMTLDGLLQDCLEAGRKALISVVTMDLSASRKRKKTSATSPSLTSSTRNVKRRRIQNGRGAAFWIVGESGEKVLNHNMLDEQDFQSSKTVKAFVEQANALDRRWFVRQFGAMLQSVSTNLVDPSMKWKIRVDSYLSNGADWADDESEDESSDEEDEDEGDQRESLARKSKRYVKYEEIQQAIDLTSQDKVLRTMDLSTFVEALQDKLAVIDRFAEDAWQLVSNMPDKLSPTVTGAGVLIQNDETLRSLKHFLQTACGKSHAVSNVEPLGRAPTVLTRSLLKAVIEHRSWFLRLLRAESERERAAFARQIIDDFDELPRLPTSISKTDEYGPRVRALRARLTNASSFETRLNPDPDTGFIPMSIAQQAVVLLELTNQAGSPFLFEAEERLAVRLDVLSWQASAEAALDSPKPKFDDIMSAKKACDLLLDGKSDTRVAVIRFVESNAAVDARIREFAKSDVSHFGERIRDRIENLYTVAAMWKEKADSIVVTLRMFGNPSAGDPIVSSRLPVAMVDLKRVVDLLAEYDLVGVDLSGLEQTLQRINDDARHWSETVTDFIVSRSSPAEECLAMIQRAAQERPKGVIVPPTRQVVDMLEELLLWYRTAKQAVVSHSDFPLDSIIEGIEVLEEFARRRDVPNRFTFKKAHAMHLISRSFSQRLNLRSLSFAKLESQHLCLLTVERSFTAEYEFQNGCPLLVLLQHVWILHVEEVQSAATSSEASALSQSLEEAKLLLSTNPEVSSGLVQTSTDWSVERLSSLISDGEKLEKDASDVLLKSKSLLRECLHRREEVGPHHQVLKDLHGEFKARAGGRRGLVLSTTLEQQLDRDVKVFHWLARIFQYPSVTTRALDNVDASDDGSDARIPWDVLVFLQERKPSLENVPGDVAYVELRLKELYDTASLWQKEVTELTEISLRGGQRRTTASSPSKVADSHDDDSCFHIDEKKVAELSNDPILLQVIMPRERAVRNMLENTKKFDVELHDFLGKDYDGEDADRASYPVAGSLVGSDGSFLLYRLTGSPLFSTLKREISRIEEISNDVFAHTPGKATFDWIRNAVRWIEALNLAVLSVNEMSYAAGRYVQRLVIPAREAKRLLNEGESIFLEVPDDLRKTLSKYKIFISTNREGRLTVRSKKGGAHHAIGVTAVCWCPFLFHSLRSDVAKHDTWIDRTRDVAQSFTSFARQMPPDFETYMFLYHGFHDTVSDLMWEAHELVVYPGDNFLRPFNTLLANITIQVQRQSTPEIARKYALGKFNLPQSVIDSRFLLLDSLCERRSINTAAQVTVLDPKTKDVGHFRQAARTLLEQALEKGMSYLGMDASPDEITAFCTMKAFEIEQELFGLFQAGKLGESQISPEYRERARALKRSFEDPDNFEFCGSVLSGIIGSDKLTRMSTEELANPKTKDERARATAEAQQHFVLTPANTGSVWANAKSEFAAVVSASSLPAVRTDGDTEMEDTEPTNTNAEDVPQQSNPVSRSRFSLNEFKAKSRSSRPPPPPSLAASLIVPKKAASIASDTYVTSSSGTDRFLISVNDGSRRFAVGFKAERDPDGCVEGLLPELLTEKGRIPIDEYTKFLKAKLEGGRWRLVTLKMDTLSEKDAREYKKYCKDYEGRSRICMFSLTETEGKIFLVTPKLHRVARSVSFESSTSTYAVVIIRL